MFWLQCVGKLGFTVWFVVYVINQDRMTTQPPSVTVLKKKIIIISEGIDESSFPCTVYEKVISVFRYLIYTVLIS